MRPEITDPYIQGQIKHIEDEHLAEFQNHAGEQSVAEYFNDHLYDKPDIYNRLASDLGFQPHDTEAVNCRYFLGDSAGMETICSVCLTPEEVPVTETQQHNTEPDEQDIQTLIQNAVQTALGSALGGITGGGQAPPPVPQVQSFEDALAEVDPTDSEAALAMLDFLLKTNRLGRVGVLDGGQGYLFMYQEPKGTTKEGYRPGATQGDRLVDEAVEAQRASGAAPAKRGMCPNCYSVVKEVEGTIVNEVTNDEVCPNSVNGHSIA